MDGVDAAVAPAAGWYADPEVSGQLRWWGGTAWTSSIRPAERTAASTPSAQLTPTERFVTSATRAGAARAQRVYLPVALARVAGPLLVVLAVAWFVAHAVPGDTSAAPVPAVVGVLLVVGVLRAAFEVERIRRTNTALDSLPTDGSVGPGEVESRVYVATWRIDQLKAATLLVASVVGIGFVAVLARADGLLDATSPGARLLLAIGLAVLLVVAVVDVRQWLSARAVASGRLTPASTARRHAAGSGGSTAAGTAALAAGRTSASSAGERVLCWSAPVMRMGVPGHRLGVVGWSFAGGVHHDSWAQNTVAVTDQALYLLCAVPASQAAVLADESYGRVKMALFYSGTEVRAEAAALLGSGMAAAMASDPRNIRIPRDTLLSLDLPDGSVGMALALTTGSTQRYIFNHADAAAGFAQQASATWLPLRRTPAPPGAGRLGLDQDGLAGTVRILIRLFAGLMALGGVVLVLLSGVGLASALSQARMTGRATGTVSAVTAVPDPLPSSHHPIVDCRAQAQFVVAGRSYTTGGASETADNCRLVVGRPVPVAYDPGDPARSMIGAPDSPAVPVMAVAVVLSLALLVGGVVLAVSAGRLVPRRPRGAVGASSSPA